MVDLRFELGGEHREEVVELVTGRILEEELIFLVLFKGSLSL
jgi:hypothetical protein